MGTSWRIQPADTTGYGNWQLTERHYLEFAERRSSPIAYRSDSLPDTSGIEFIGWNRGWNYNAVVFHIRGPDGPRGGRTTLCGVRARGGWGPPEIPPPADRIVSAARGRSSWSLEWCFRPNGYDQWGVYRHSAYAYPCPRCAGRYLLTANA